MTFPSKHLAEDNSETTWKLKGLTWGNCLFLESIVGAGQAAQRLLASTVLTKDSSSGPGTHIRQLTSMCNSSCRGSDALAALFLILQAPALTCTHTYTQADA